MQKLPRGVRNNNPGNIDYSKANNWLGQLGLELGVPNPRFARFDKPENGIRAIAKILLSYQRKGFNTPTKIINRWAPPSENNTVAYVRRVARGLGVSPDAVLEFTPAQVEELAWEIIGHEQGYQPYTRAVVNAGVRSAF